MNTTVSIILCSYNRADHLEKTLRSFREVKVPEDWTAELILVDNASTDTTAEVMQAFDHPEMPVRVVREDKQGVNNARNRAVEKAQGQVFLFTDDDVRFPRGWIKGMCTPILQDDADAVAGGVELAGTVQRDWMTPRHRELLASTERIHAESPDRMVGANMAVGKHVFDTIPKFDPELGPGQLGLGGETLFALQMREVGFEIETAFDVVVRHYPSRSRLGREKWKEAAKKSGRAGAYRSYHWEHRQYSLPVLLAGWGYYTFRLYCSRVLDRVFSDTNSPMPIWEFHLRRRIHRICYHFREYGTSVKYNKYGLLKKSIGHYGE